ncbi:MAG: hypothetical protein L0271_22830, partial [Gemmatimonadetes bacterium]|nr:hypothetical protein [Gemmatimonadota bacterium]
MIAHRTLALSMLIAAAAAAPLAAQDAFNWRGRVASGRTLEIKGLNGSITATAASGPEISVSAEKSARRSNPDEVRIEVVEHDGGVTICAVYPTPRDREPNECRPGEGGRMNNQRNDTEVDFTVAVPTGVRLVARTVNGSVTATDL